MPSTASRTGSPRPAKIADRQISNGQLNFQANSDEFHVNGTADLDGVPAELILDGFGDAEPGGARRIDRRCR